MSSTAFPLDSLRASDEIGEVLTNQEGSHVQSLDPLADPRWPIFLERSRNASVFHSRGWLQAIRATYGYQRIVFTTSEGAELTNAVVFCRINSWLTGRRLVSLPFSDHCQPLAEGRDFQAILRHLQKQTKDEQQRYIELRPEPHYALDADTLGFSQGASFCLQAIDLRPDLKVVYGGFHDSCIRRKIKRAERECLTHEAGRTPELLMKFRKLFLLTRRRHKLPPQPAAWFRNIVDSLKEMVTVHVASKDGIPVASILTLKYKNKLVYKYGCSDGEFANLGGTPMLFWKAIQMAKAEGLEEFDLGRSDFSDPGLIAFKRHLGAVSSRLAYYRDTASAVKKDVCLPTESPKETVAGPSRWAREALVRLPDTLLSGVGELLYRHIG